MKPVYVGPAYSAFLGVVLSTVIAGASPASNTLKSIGCENNGTWTEILSVEGNQVKFFAQDDDGLADFRGTLTKLTVENVVLLEAQAPGYDAVQVLKVFVDTVGNTISIHQTEIDTISAQYSCNAISVK